MVSSLVLKKSVQFQEVQLIKALINSGNNINAITLAYTVKQGLTTWKTSAEAQKIDGWLLEIFGMVLARFLLQDNLDRVWFFDETFLLANISIEVVLKISFLFVNNGDVKFAESKKLTWRSFNTAEALPTTS